MQNIDRIQTTHVGSLPRPLALEQLLLAREKGEISPEQSSELPAMISDAVRDIVRRQRQIGLDIVSDGEMSKYAYATYARNRMSGLEGGDQPLALSELAEFPDFASKVVLDIKTPACCGPLVYHGQSEVQTDISVLQAALAETGGGQAFMNASSPGIMATYMPNQHYATQDDYLEALAAVMKHEYDAIAASGLLLQIDCPDMALGRHFRPAPAEVGDFRRELGRLIEVLNHALRDIPADRMRLHLCWGNYNSPHHHDIDLAEILDLILTVRPGAILLEGANPRHEHEWAVFKDIPLPEDKVLVPGVIDTCTNYIEHPENVAQRLQRYADVVGRDRVLAGTDCGFASFATLHNVDSEIGWRKLRSLVEGAEIASGRLW